MPKNKAVRAAAPPADPVRRKLAWALWIMGLGMLFALAWCAFQGWILGRGYPDNTILFPQKIRFNDWTDDICFSRLWDPYADPFAFYLPPAWVYARLTSLLPIFYEVYTCLVLGASLAYFFLERTLAPVVGFPWKRVLAVLLLLGCSYPFLFSLDRCNLELLMAMLVAGTLFFLAQSRYVPAMVCLVPAISLKIYPALFLLFFLRQRKIGLIFAGGAAVLVLTLLSAFFLSLPLAEGLGYLSRNMTFFRQVYLFENFSLEGSGSLWNFYKLCVVLAGQLGLIAPPDFRFDSTFVGLSYGIYISASAFLLLFLAVHALWLEKEMLRGAAGLLLFLACATPSGADYRLLYAALALVLVIRLKTRRRFDFVVLVLLSLVMVPKKEIFLKILGNSETGFPDVSLQVLINPPLVFTALLLLVWDSYPRLDLNWSRRRLFRTVQTIFPWIRPRPALRPAALTT